ncbi:MAG TPA: hypothetical protein VM509_02090 [Planctomycetota bacterium]|nr:hypothetical protein [Planctomycetota bacterium]
MLLAALNTEVMKYVLIVGTFPVWMPFLKALYTELDDALASEGGLLGRTPTPRELKAIEADPHRSKSPLVSRDRPEDASAPRGGRTVRTSAPERSVTATRARGTTGTIGFSKPRGPRGFARKDQRRS